MTSMPASRNARATTLAPRSWPSSPGFAIRTRIFFAIGITSVEERLLPYPEGLSHDVADLAKGRLGAYRLEDQRHRVVLGLAGLAKAVESLRVLSRVPCPSEFPEPIHLGLEGGFRDLERLHIGLLIDDEVVHPDDDPLFVLDFPLVAVRRIRDLLLEESLADCGDHPSEFLDAVEVAVRLLLEFVCESLEEVRAPERVDRVRDAALVGKDLLRAQGDPRGRLIRDLIGLVVGVRMEGLGSAQDGSEDRKSTRLNSSHSSTSYAVFCLK